MKNRVFICLVLALTILSSCSKETTIGTPPVLILKNGPYTPDGEYVPVGGKLRFGITSTDGGGIITNLRIKRIVNGKAITELDKGLYLSQGGLDYDFYAVKSSAETEVWEFFVMNSNRDSAVTRLNVYLGEGSAYGEINHFPSIILGMQDNKSLPNYLNLETGLSYPESEIAGHEHEIDLVGFVYTTSGVLSPTLCCPGYTGSSSVTGFYPQILSWTTRKLTVYDYYSSDNNLVDPADFLNASNDSLLVESFKPGSVSGLCKYCFKDKILPFKTENGKYGLVRVLHADLTTNGIFELEIKIQK
jgi:hypothetical protein